MRTGAGQIDAHWSLGLKGTLGKQVITVASRSRK